MSNEQKQYLKKIKHKKLLIFIIQILIITSFLVFWEFLVNKEILNEFIFSKPSKVFESITNLLITNNLFNHIFTTLYEIIIAFVLGIILGFIGATLLYEFPMLEKVLDPFLTLLNSLPKVALGPLIIIIAGANIKSVIVMALLINLIISITTIYNGFTNTDKNKIKLLNSFNATKIQILTKLVIPASYKTIISSLKLNISMSQIGVIMGEFLVSKAGIGYLIIYGTQVFNLSLVMSGIFILIIISFILYKLVSLLENKLLKRY
ncbi:MAG: ABC transporter permease [Bacilli bacterium]